MRDNHRCCYWVIALAVVIAAGVLALFYSGFLTLGTLSPVIPAFLAIGALSLFSLFISTLIANRCRALNDAYCRGGNVASVGGIGLILSALITSLFDNDAVIVLEFAMAVCFFFLTLLLGGIFCFLYAYHSCPTCRCQNNGPCPGSPAYTAGAYPFVPGIRNENRPSGYMTGCAEAVPVSGNCSAGCGTGRADGYIDNRIDGRCNSCGNCFQNEPGCYTASGCGVSTEYPGQGNNACR